MKLKNTVVAITGGASGLGEASTRHFVAHGAKVMILDINDDNAKAICDELGDENVKYINTNIMEEQPVVDAMAFIKESFGKLDVAINCAGTGYGGRILGKEAPHPLDHFKFIVDLNLVGMGPLVSTTDYCLPILNFIWSRLSCLMSFCFV